MRHTRTVFCLASTLPLLAAIPAASQEPNPYGRFTFSQELRLSDNPDIVEDPPGATLTARTGLGFEYGAETRVQSLRLSLGTDLEGRFGEADRDYDFVNDRATLSFSRDGANAGLDLTARYRNTPFDDIEIGEEGDPDFLVIDAGRRELQSIGLGFDIGRDARTSLEFDLGWSKTDYVDTVDPDLLDSETFDLDARASFALTRSLDASLLAGIQETDEEGDVTRESSYIGVGLSGETRSGFTFSGDLTYDRSETVGGANPKDVDGVGFNLSLRQDRPLGAYSLTLGSRIDDAGRYSRISLGRDLELPRGGLSWSVGVTDYDDTDPGLTGSVSWTQETRDGLFVADLQRTQRPNDSVPYADTRVGLTYSGDLTEISRWGASLSYFAEDELNGSDDASRTSASVSYSRDLTKDWSLNTGYEYTLVDPASGEDRDRNSVFVTIQRDVIFGF